MGAKSSSLDGPSLLLPSVSETPFALLLALVNLYHSSIPSWLLDNSATVVVPAFLLRRPVWGDELNGSAPVVNLASVTLPKKLLLVPLKT